MKQKFSDRDGASLYDPEQRFSQDCLLDVFALQFYAIALKIDRGNKLADKTISHEEIN